MWNKLGVKEVTTKIIKKKELIEIFEEFRIENK